MSRSWKAPVSTDKWIKKCGKVIQYNIIQLLKNTFMKFSDKWIELKTVILSKHSLDPKRQVCMFFPYTY